MMKAKREASIPKISVNKLAEYLEAHSNRRKAIVIDAKYPKKFKTTRYTEAREAIKIFLRDKKDEEFILKIIKDLRKKPIETEFQETDVNTSIESLESFLLSDLTQFDPLVFKDTPKHKGEYLNINGVNISISPDLLITSKKNNSIGGLKIHLSKSYSLNKESQLNVGVLTDLFVGDVMKLRTGSKKISASLDVFDKSLQFCPTASKIRMEKIGSACEEIEMWWNKV